MNGSLPTGASAPTAGGSTGTGGVDPDFDTLAELYAFGLANDPDVDNRLLGSYFAFDIDDDGHLFVDQTATDDGSGENQHPPIEATRFFTNNAARGLMARWEQRYTGTATDRVGGMQFRHYLSDDNTERLYCNVRPTLSDGGVATYFNPSYSSGGLCSFYALDLCGRTDALGEFHTFSGDGNYTQQARIPAGVEGGTVLGSLITNATAIGGGFMGNGDGVGWWVTENAYHFGRQQWRQESFDSGPVTRCEFLLANNVAGLIEALTLYVDRVNVPHDLVVAEDITSRTQPVPVTLVSDEVTLTATGVTAIPGTTIPGFVFLPLANPRWKTTAVAGSVSTAPTVKAGNNGARDNLMIAAAAPATAAFAAGVNGYASASANAVNSQMLNLSTPLSVEVTVAATGTGLTWRARLYQVGLLMPV